jgi:hypothetical protein
MRKQGRITNAVIEELRKTNKAVVYSIDADRVNLQFADMPNLIHDVEVIGEASLLRTGETVDIIWRDGRPVVIAFRPGSAVGASVVSAVPASALEYLATREANQTIGNASWTRVTFNAVTRDTGSIGNGDHAIIPSDGLYMVETTIEFNANATGGRGVRLARGAAGDQIFTYVMGDNTGALNWRSSHSRMVRLEGGEQIAVQVYQNSTGNLAIIKTDYAPVISIIRVGE